MSNRHIHIIVEKIFRQTYSNRIVRVDQIVSQIAMDLLGYDSVAAYDYADRNKNSIWSEVVKLNTIIVTQNARNPHHWRPRLQGPETVVAHSVPP
jgi:hypothetical protein